MFVFYLIYFFFCTKESKLIYRNKLTSEIVIVSILPGANHYSTQFSRREMTTNNSHAQWWTLACCTRSWQQTRILSENVCSFILYIYLIPPPFVSRLAQVFSPFNEKHPDADWCVHCTRMYVNEEWIGNPLKRPGGVRVRNILKYTTAILRGCHAYITGTNVPYFIPYDYSHMQITFENSPYDILIKKTYFIISARQWRKTDLKQRQR